MVRCACGVSVRLLFVLCVVVVLFGVRAKLCPSRPRGLSVVFFLLLL